MRAALSSLRLGARSRARSRIVTVRVDRCYHYRAFRYGGFGNNPYEDFVVALAAGEPVADVRAAFAKVVLTTAPRTMGEALQLELPGWPAWAYPWEADAAMPATVVEPADNPDIVSHFCAAGVLSSHINREFGWLERAFKALWAEGYRPDLYGHVICLELRAEERSSFVVLDGNHRISALYALGITELEVQVAKRRCIVRDEVDCWPAVASGARQRSDALAVFDRYFQEANPPYVCRAPSTLIADEPPAW